MASHNTIAAPERHIPQLDGLRGIAILLVLGYHYFPGYLFFNFGWSGVDLFFVLSGFLIAGRVLPFLRQGNFLQRFFRNRLLRIVPLYFLFLVIFLIVFYSFSPVSTTKEFHFYRDYAFSFFLFLQNWFFIAHPADSKIHLQHLWSLAVEEQIYLFFPFLALALKRMKRILIAAIALVVVSIAARSVYAFFLLQGNNYESIYFNTFFRLDPFFTGVILCIVYQDDQWRSRLSRFLRWAGIASALFLLTYILCAYDAEKNNIFMETIGFALVTVTYAALCWYCVVDKNGWLARTLSVRFLRFAGKISFGLYIIHWPLYILGFGLSNKMVSACGLPLTPQQLQFFNAAWCLPLSFLLAWLSYRYYESGFLRLKSRH